METLHIAANSLVSGLLLGGVLALAALGLSIVLGVMGLVNLAHGEFVVAGGYLMLFVLQPFDIDPMLAFPLIAAIMAAIALALQRTLLRPLAGGPPESSMMTMFALSIVLQNLYLTLFQADTRSIQLPSSAQSVEVGPVSFGMIYLVGFLISVLVIFAAHCLITSTQFGRDLRASAADPEAAEIVGVDVERVRGWTLALGAACAALGGVLAGAIFGFTPISGPAYLLNAFAIVVLGGLGNVFGTLVGGVVLGVLQSVGGVAFGDGYRDLVGLLVLLIILGLCPQGLMGRKHA
ncbi:MAG TPA: branched-chain amino acid ABC transporter permease [Noviherbaspirillum sp.]|uniref:branched-chain amino acid ABC transporter permease n=1 Tax=Noviherbaspirillum sp. TaxID=1926288 RepID=UPI002D5EDEFC|nr:branched-chain amino acid ABC transporter permease [Noviherbaspirillum sp.]HYD95906.1 branched-chain amino acid ABC transporter permease [Noviherbaspirillum sp.]